MIGWALKFLSDWQGYATAALAAFLVGSVGSGYAVAKLKNGEIARINLEHQTALLDAATSAMTLQAKADAITHDIDVKIAEDHQKIVEKTITLIRKVPVYVTAETDKLFPLPCGVIRLHDAAAAGVDASEIPLRPGESDDTACPVKASEAIAIIADNYGQALSWRSSLINWQDWYRMQSDLADKDQ